MNNLYDVLETCLQDIEKGADIETVLFRYPDLADELRPILETSVKAMSIMLSDPAADVVRRNRAKVLQRAAQMRESKVRSSRRLWLVPLRRAMVTGLVVAALFVSSINLVRAASTTLPGDNLYPVKRTWEEVSVLLTFDTQARETLEVEQENERLEEIYKIFADGRSVQVEFVGSVTHQNGDLWLVSQIPVVLSAQTDLIAQSIAIGNAVRVVGVTQADGTVLAARIELLPAGVPLPEVDDDMLLDLEQENSGPGSGNETPEVEETQTVNQPAESSVRGTISSVNGTILVVDGQPIDISNAEINNAPTAGARIRAEGYFADNGVFIATKIEFLDGGSNSGNDTGSDDNGNDSNNNDNGGGEDDHSGEDNFENSNTNTNENGNTNTSAIHK